MRYYISPQDVVRTDLLVPSETQTLCPYQGVASYRFMQTKNGEEVVEDLVWYYPAPLLEAQKVEGHLCFYDEKVKIEVHG